jgi:hypothetical protein
MIATDGFNESVEEEVPQAKKKGKPLISRIASIFCEAISAIISFFAAGAGGSAGVSSTFFSIALLVFLIGVGLIVTLILGNVAGVFVIALYFLILGVVFSIVGAVIFLPNWVVYLYFAPLAIKWHILIFMGWMLVVIFVICVWIAHSTSFREFRKECKKKRKKEEEEEDFDEEEE